jgi:hypothetical protein
MKCLQCYRITPCRGWLVLAFALFTLVSALPLTAQQAGDWVKIGEKKVNRKLDRDEIPILKSNDKFTAIQFRVLRSTVNIARCSVYFENGKVKDVRMGREISEGSASKIVKFGVLGARSVKKVVVWYDTVDDSDKRGQVEIWARR